MSPGPALRLASPFSDHLVLQRGRACPVWGWDHPGQRIVLEVDGQERASTLTREDGSWRLDCPELSPGGPYRLRVRGSREQVIEDVLVGEVWLASGQSNMEFALSSIADAQHAIADAQHPEIRLFGVAQTISPEPATTVLGQWSVCTPENAGAFSAVAYFFARELQERLGVPVGILSASWGGTPVEAWTSLDALHAVPGFDQELARLAVLERDAPRLRAEFQEAVLRWEREQLPSDPGNGAEALGWARTDFDDQAWSSLTTPGYWQSQGLKHNGVVWYRRRVSIPEAWTGQDLVLSLGALDDFDVTYFAGTELGSHPKGTPFAHRIPRRYTIPGSLVQAGPAVVAVRIFDHVGDGGFVGPASELFLAPAADESARIDLAGTWRARVEHEVPLVPGEVWQLYPTSALPEPHYVPAVLYGGMIAPLVPYAIRGAIWYQGESNAESHARYRDHQIALIRDWRARFGVGQFPFYLVQLAGYRCSPTWPLLREAQAHCLAEPATGMAVAIDVGDALDIHPRNKQAVGQRLALLALCHTYGQAVASEGPTLDHVVIAEGRATVHLRHAEGLRTRNGSPNVLGFSLAGADGQYHDAQALIEGSAVVVSSSAVPAPRTVRYAWADYLETNLENAAGLPGVPFRTDGYG